MPLIWCAISGHGYGHAAQVAPVLNALGRSIPGLRARLRTSVPAAFFEPRLTIPWELSPAQQDIGCVQQGPLQIDVPGTWAAHRLLHDQWEPKIAAEAALIRAADPRCVLADIPHLAVAAGAAAGRPTVGMCSLSWDLVLTPFVEPMNREQATIIQQVRDAYAQADCFLRVAPGLPVTAFRTMHDIGPIAEPAEPQRAILRHAVGAAPADRVVFVGFGGIALRELPFAQMEQMPGYRFIVDGPVPDGGSRLRALATLPLSFTQLLASVDAILTKPGYGTIVEAVALGIPVVYVRRYNFADEHTLVEYLHRHGRGAELSLADFRAAQWHTALQAVFEQPPGRPAPPLSGPSDAARLLARYF